MLSDQIDESVTYDIDSDLVLESLKEPSEDTYNIAKLQMYEAIKAASELEVGGRIGDNNNDVNTTKSTYVPPSKIAIDIVGTLNEPVTDTILRDLKHVALKMKYVLVPGNTLKELRNWDLWGPLFLCLILAATLSWTAKEDQSVLVFTSIFVIVWVGSAVVTLNAALLGAKISFLQSVCVLGYCLCPLSIGSIVCRFWGNKIFQSIVVLICLIWSISASIGFMAQLVKAERKVLAMYPVVLFYTAISWMILVQ